MTHLILIRHAQTVSNVEGRWIGWGGTAITPLGRAHIAAVARRVAAEHADVAALYTSSFDRARETADAIGAALELESTVDEDLKEINVGELDGITVEEMAARYPALHTHWENKTDSIFQWPGGEQRGDFFRRVARPGPFP